MTADISKKYALCYQRKSGVDDGKRHFLAAFVRVVDIDIADVNQPGVDPIRILAGNKTKAAAYEINFKTSDTSLPIYFTVWFKRVGVPCGDFAAVGPDGTDGFTLASTYESSPDENATLNFASVQGNAALLRLCVRVPAVGNNDAYPHDARTLLHKSLAHMLSHRLQASAGVHEYVPSTHAHVHTHIRTQICC